MHTTNYINTLIVPAEDCKSIAKVPAKADSIAGMQYDMLIDRAYQQTSDDLLSRVAAQRKGVPKAAGYLEFRREFFAKKQPCLRASPLTKTHGWAIHSNHVGLIALIHPESDEFKKLSNQKDIEIIKAMRNKRA